MRRPSLVSAAALTGALVLSVAEAASADPPTEAAAPETPSATALPAADGRAPRPDEAGEAAGEGDASVIVTANRFPLASADVGASVTVLTAADLQREQSLEAADVLARTPGVALARNGGPGELTSLFIRGAPSDQTLVLIDGVKVNDPTDPAGGFDFSNLPVGDIARIEVLRGPQSTLYGSEAIGGVVNIVTAGADRPFGASARIEGGSFGTGYASGSLQGRGDGWSLRLGALYQASDGIPALDPRFGGSTPRGFDEAGVSARGTARLAAGLELDERVYFTSSRNEFDGYDTPSGAFGDDPEFGRTREAVDYTGLNASLFDGRFRSRLAFEYSRLDRQNEDPIQPLTKFTYKAAGERTEVEYEGTLALSSRVALVFGAEDRRDVLSSSTPEYAVLYGEGPVRGAADLAGGYVQATIQPLRGLTLTGGARHDEHTTFGGRTTGQVSAAWSLFDGNTLLRSSWGQGFKAPSLYQLYSPYGNLALRPETATGWDAGIEQRLLAGALVLQATYFSLDTRNLIDFVDCYGVTTGACATNLVGGYYDNVARTRSTGVETAAKLRPLPGLQFALSYTYNPVKDESPGAPTQGLQLARRPVNAATLEGDYVWPAVRLSTGFALSYAGERWDDDAHTIPLKSYTLLTLRASYPIRTGLDLYARIENVGDRRYETAYPYASLGRALYGGVRATF